MATWEREIRSLRNGCNCEERARRTCWRRRFSWTLSRVGNSRRESRRNGNRDSRRNSLERSYASEAEIESFHFVKRAVRVRADLLLRFGGSLDGSRADRDGGREPGDRESEDRGARR